eukprot:scaffold85006_cov63-Attheya_sp.AAC.2
MSRFEVILPVRNARNALPSIAPRRVIFLSFRFSNVFSHASSALFDYIAFKMASTTRAAALAALPDHAAVAAAAAAATAAATAAVAPAVPVAGFVLSPAHDQTCLTRKGAEALPIRLANGDRGFDGKITHLKLFLSCIKQRANVFDWHNLLEIPVDGVNKNLLEAYGQISMVNVQVHVQTYIAQPTRDVQNSFMMYECLSQSLMVAALNDVLTEIGSFTESDLQSGPLFLIYRCQDFCLRRSVYEDGTLDLEEESLMNIARRNKFDALVQDGTWNRPSRVQEQSIALAATHYLTLPLSKVLWQGLLLIPRKPKLSRRRSTMLVPLELMRERNFGSW